jgi:glycine cleavage system regulatory protein
MTSVPEITRMLARIQEWKGGHGQVLGPAEAARRLDEALALLTEAGDLLIELRQALRGATRTKRQE